ncbi:A-kinase anchor protein 12-like isoform X2 [Carcharodon carcharias]|uniref:A-kinase anchor protein 12-like isoform X2 n=1 Tax=Carcharodon carcharias TaxID=13397 RepID=UPI001B7EB118|nr:A-kinase anchor protein 12-like isoform X2 [Carcharodon carcharias]
MPGDEQDFSAKPVEPTSISREEELGEMELGQKETPTETKDEEQKDFQEVTDPLAEIGEEAQAGEIGFKKVFKFVGCKLTVKKEKPVKLEPVQLLTVKNDEDGEVDSESKQEMEGSKNGEVNPAADEADRSPPEVLSPGKMEESIGQAEPKPAAAEEPLVQVESATSPVESPAVDSPLKRFFRQGFFSVLRRKPSFKKAKDEPLVIGEESEVNGEQKENGEQIIALGVVKGEEGDHGAKTQKEASTSQEAAEILDVQTIEKSERDDDFEDLTAELASVREAKEAPTIDEGEDGVSAKQDQLRGPELRLTATALETDQANQLTTRAEQSALAGGQSVSIEAAEELRAEHADIAQEQSSLKALEPIMGEAELLSSQEKAKLQGSPLKKLFTGSSIKKLSGKKTKAKKGETNLGDAGDDVRLQSSTESEGSPEGQKPDTPLTSPEEMGEKIPVETVEMPDVHPEAEGVNGAANGETKKESITAWASFKKLVTSKKRSKVPSESDKEDEPIDKAKSATISSNESAASVDNEEAKSVAEEQSLEQSTEDPKKKADAPVSWEALICVGSSKKRARKLSDSEAPKLNEEAQKLTEDSSQVQDGAEELKASSLQDTDQEQGGASPEGVASPVEGEVSGVASTWESFKRLVTSRRKSKSKLEERVDESVTSPEAVLPETESAKEESWASFKKLIPGRRKKRSDAKPEQSLAEGVGKETNWTEFGVSKSDEESDTPAVVPLSEYDAIEEERLTKEQQITVAADSVYMGEVPITSEAPLETRELSTEQTVTVERGPLEAIKSSIDERSPSWISAAVSDAIVKDVEDEKIVEGTVAANKLVKEPMVHGDITPSADVTGETYPVEIAEEAQEITSEVVMAPEYPAEESLTEETTEMVSAVSQLTETPVTTAEGTPIREDEALVNKQTQEVLQEAAEKVKLSASPGVSFCKMVAASEMQEPEISMEKIQDEVVKVSCEIEVPESAQKGETETSDTASEASEVTRGASQAATVESEEVQQELGEMVEQTTIEMQEVSVAWSIQPETTPPIESTAAHLEITAEVVQDVEVNAAHVVECGILRDEKIKGPVGMLHKTDDVLVKENVIAEIETGKSEAVVNKLGTEKVERVLEGTLEASRAEDVAKPEATCEEPTEAIRASCMEKILTEYEETTEAAPTEAAEKMGAEEVAECREATEVIPAEIAENVEAVLEQTGEAIPEVVHRMKVGKAEAVFEETTGDSQEIGEVGAEKAVGICREALVSVKNIEAVCEQSTEIIPATMEVNVTETVCNEETVQITPVVETTEAVLGEETIEIIPVVMGTEVCSEETVNITPVVEATEAVLGEETIEITPVVTVTEVCSEETVNITPVVETIEAVLGEETIEITPVVMVTKVCSEETVNVTPVVETTEALLGEETIEITPVVTVTKVCSEETVITPDVETTEAVLEETIEITPVLTVTEVCSEETVNITPVVETTEAVLEETIEITPVVMVTKVCSEETVNITPVVAMTEAILSEEDVQITPVVEVTEVLHSEAPNKNTPIVEAMGVACREKAIESSPVVVTEIVCSEDTTGVISVGVMEAVESEEIVKSSAVVEVMEVVCEDAGAMVAVAEAGRNEEITEISLAVEVINDSPVVEETEAVCSQETIDASPVVEVMAVHSQEAIDASPAVEVMAVHSQEATDASPVVEEMEPTRGQEAIYVSPVVEEMAVCSQEAIDVSSDVEVTEAVGGQEVTEICPTVETVCSEETIDIGLVKVGMEESKSVPEEKSCLVIIKQGEIERIEKDVHVIATDNDKIAQEQFSAVQIMQEMAEVKKYVEAEAENMETEMNEVVYEEITKTLERIDEQKTKEQVVESLIPAMAIIQQDLSIIELSKETIQDVAMPTENTEGQVDTVSTEQDKDDDQMHKYDKEKMPGLQKVTATEEKGDEVVGQTVQTQESKDTEALEQEVVVVMQSTKVVFEDDQKPVETEADASVGAEKERKLLSDHVSEESAMLPDVAKMTEVECCQSLERPEGTCLSLELTEGKGQPIKTQPPAEEKTSVQDVPARMISPIEENLTQGVANEKLEGDATESIGHEDDKETDQNKVIEAVEKQESQEVQIRHQMDQSTLECAKDAAEKTPS